MKIKIIIVSKILGRNLKNSLIIRKKGLIINQRDNKLLWSSIKRDNISKMV
jgi:hypothetical protein